MPQAIEYHLFQRVEADVEAVAAGTAVARGGTAEQIGADFDVAGPAFAALGQPGDQEARPLARPERLVVQIRPCVTLEEPLSFLHRIPSVLRDDPQLRHVLRDETVGIVQAGDALSGRRVLDIAQPVPDQAADVELIVEDAGTAGGIAIDRRCVPFAAARARNTVSVQFSRNPPRRFAGGELGEDATHCCRFGLINLATAMDRLASGIVLADDVIAKTQSTAGSPLPDPAFEPAACLFRKIFEE